MIDHIGAYIVGFVRVHAVVVEFASNWFLSNSLDRFICFTITRVSFNGKGDIWKLVMGFGGSSAHH